MATAPDSRQHLHELVDQLNEQQVPQAADALEAIHQASLEAILRSVPGLPRMHGRQGVRLPGYGSPGTG